MKELIDQYLGKEASIQLRELKVRVRIVDVKRSYGRLRFLVQPLEGKGEMWIESVDMR